MLGLKSRTNALNNLNGWIHAVAKYNIRISADLDVFIPTDDNNLY